VARRHRLVLAANHDAAVLLVIAAAAVVRQRYGRRRLAMLQTRFWRRRQDGTHCGGRGCRCSECSATAADAAAVGRRRSALLRCGNR